MRRPPGDNRGSPAPHVCRLATTAMVFAIKPLILSVGTMLRDRWDNLVTGVEIAVADIQRTQAGSDLHTDDDLRERFSITEKTEKIPGTGIFKAREPLRAIRGQKQLCGEGGQG